MEDTKITNFAQRQLLMCVAAHVSKNVKEKRGARHIADWFLKWWCVHHARGFVPEPQGIGCIAAQPDSVGDF